MQLKLSPKEFAGLVRRLQDQSIPTDDKTVAIARRILVDGATGPVIAEEFGVSFQYVYKVKGRFVRELEATPISLLDAKIKAALADHRIPNKLRLDVLRALRLIGLLSG